MRITFLVACLTHGGAEKVASLWIKGFVTRGYDVSCILFSDDTPISYELPACVKIRKVHSHGQGLIHNFRQIRELRAYLMELKPNVLIAILHPLGLFGYIASRGLGIKVINTEHNTFDRPDYVPFGKTDRIYKFLINKLFDKVTIFTHADITYVSNRLSNMTYLPNPLSMKPAVVVPKKNNIILAVGRMEAWHVKGFDLLIDAWGRIFKNYPDWKLQILGGGEQKYRDLLINQAKSNGTIDSIEFIDFTPDPQQYFSEASIFVLSSRYEGFGMVLLEAMSQGCACVSCDYKGRQSEIIAFKKNGLTCNTDNSEALKNSLSYMLDNESYRESVRQNAINRSKDFELDKIMNTWENIVKSV